MSKKERFLLDADSFIRSKREHYAFDICPGFWDALLQASGHGRVVSIAAIRTELLRGKDALANWVKDSVPENVFEAVEIDGGGDAYRRVADWVENSQQYSRAAKQKFFGDADPLLVAAAITNGDILATYEVSAPNSKAIVKIPDVARHFGVKCIAPYVMLRRLGVRLSLDRRKGK